MSNVAAVPEFDDGPVISDRVRLEILIREEVNRRLGAEKKERKSWAEHPAILLVLGFILTTGAGSMVTSWWQYEQWARQQHYRAAQEITKERAAVMNLAAQAIAQSFTAAEDVLKFSAWPWRKRSDVTVLKETAANWTTESRRWRISEKVLVARVAAAYPDKETAKFLEAIISSRKQLGNDITNVLAIEDQTDRTARDHAEISATSDHALEIINRVTGKDGTLRQLITHMVSETRKDDQLPPPQSFWRWLFTS